jgi:hypothetical protein
MLIKVFVKFYFVRAYKLKYVFNNFNPKRDGPYFLIGNHVHFLDAFFSSFPIKGYGIPVVNSFLLTGMWQRFILTVVVEAIGKRKGQSDIKTIKDIRKNIEKGNVISIYPEGNASYYGDSTESVYATAKLLKKQKIDVVCAKTKGAYFAKPRWRKTKAIKPYMEIEMSTLFTGKQLEDLSVEEIYKKMIASYYQNDYEWNKDKKIIYKGKNRLKGAERVIYGCPKCGSINTINTSGDSITCDNCDLLGTINDYGFIEGTKYDNFIDWGTFQEELLKRKLDEKIEFGVKVIRINLSEFKKFNLGQANLIYEKKMFTLKNKKIDLKFNIKNMIGPAYTKYDEFSFDYENETYMFISENPKLLLDITKLIKEE